MREQQIIKLLAQYPSSTIQDYLNNGWFIVCAYSCVTMNGGEIHYVIEREKAPN